MGAFGPPFLWMKPTVNAQSQLVPAQLPTSKKRKSSWTRYWLSGALHSCIDSFENNYAGGIAGFWVKSFGDLGASDQVLDLCTGNGPVPRLLVEALPVAKLPQIVGVDMSDLSPTWLQAMDEKLKSRITLRENTNIESLPFEPASFSMVTSQYGMEYANQALVLDQVRNVLRPSGRLVCVLHHADSRLIEVGAAEIAHFSFLLGADGPFKAAKRLVPFMAMRRGLQAQQKMNSNKAAVEARADYNRSMAVLRERCISQPFPDIYTEVGQGIAAAMAHASEAGAGRARRMLENLRLNLEDSLLRLQEMLEFALTEQGASALKQGLQQRGFEVLSLEPVRFESHLMGWGLVARKGS